MKTPLEFSQTHIKSWLILLREKRIIEQKLKKTKTCLFPGTSSNKNGMTHVFPLPILTSRGLFIAGDGKPK